MKLHELFETQERSILSVFGKQEDPFPGDFYCNNNKLTSLVGAPSVIKGHFSCNNNKLTSLVGAPSVIKGNFLCYSNNLTSLVGAPSVIKGNVYCSYNKLTSLVGASSVIKGSFFGDNNKLTSLKGIDKIIKEINGFADFTNNPIKSHVLGLLRIKGLQYVLLDNKQVEDILNKYLEGDRDIFACQSELLDAGLEDFAQL